MYTIGITGGTASGKTTFFKNLKKHFKDQVNFISQDDYYIPTNHLSPEENEKINFDHPDSLDFNLLNQHILQLKKGLSIEKPFYSFSKHCRLDKTEIISPKNVLIIEGILILSDLQTKKLVDHSIFIDTPNDIRLARRIERDYLERSIPKDKTLQFYEAYVAPMYDLFIAPQKKDVNLVINGNANTDKDLEKIIQLIDSKL